MTNLTRAPNLSFGAAYYPRARRTPGIQITPMLAVALGIIATADADGGCASQALSTGVDGAINGALAASGVATFATARNVVAAWTGAAVITITGTDEYGETIVESSAS